MVLFYLIVTLGVACAFGFATMKISENKGYYGGFAWGFWLGFIGLIVVLAKPENPALYQETSSNYSMHDSLSDRLHRINNGGIRQSNSTGPDWTCVCGNKNSIKYDNCTRCNRDRRDSEQIANTQKCPHCGATNNAKNENCFACNKSLKVEPPKATSIPQQKITNENTAELIAQIAKLHEQGILTDEEFQNKKAELLKRL